MGSLLQGRRPHGKAMNHLKEWAGLGSMLVILMGVSAFCLCLIFQLIHTRKRDLALVTQAMYAIKAGHSSQAWLLVMKD